MSTNYENSNSRLEEMLKAYLEGKGADASLPKPQSRVEAYLKAIVENRPFYTTEEETPTTVLWQYDLEQYMSGNNPDSPPTPNSYMIDGESYTFTLNGISATYIAQTITMDGVTVTFIGDDYFGIMEGTAAITEGFTYADSAELGVCSINITDELFFAKFGIPFGEGAPEGVDLMIKVTHSGTRTVVHAMNGKYVEDMYYTDLDNANTLIDNRTLTLEVFSSVDRISGVSIDPVPCTIRADSKYLVVYNGVEYFCEGVPASRLNNALGSGVILLGNMASYGGVDNGMPFTIVNITIDMYEQFIVYDRNGANNCTISVLGNIDIKKIPDMYIPDSVADKLATIEEGAQRNVPYDWNSDNGTAPILNKPATPSGTRIPFICPEQSSITGGYLPSGSTIFIDLDEALNPVPKHIDFNWEFDANPMYSSYGYSSYSIPNYSSTNIKSRLMVISGSGLFVAYNIFVNNDETKPRAHVYRYELNEAKVTFIGEVFMDNNKTPFDGYVIGLEASGGGLHIVGKFTSGMITCRVDGGDYDGHIYAAPEEVVSDIVKTFDIPFDYKNHSYAPAFGVQGMANGQERVYVYKATSTGAEYMGDIVDSEINSMISLYPWLATSRDCIIRTYKYTDGAYIYHSDLKDSDGNMLSCESSAPIMATSDDGERLYFTIDGDTAVAVMDVTTDAIIYNSTITPESLGTSGIDNIESKNDMLYIEYNNSGNKTDVYQFDGTTHVFKETLSYDMGCFAYYSDKYRIEKLNYSDGNIYMQNVRIAHLSLDKSTSPNYGVCIVDQSTTFQEYIGSAQLLMKVEGDVLKSPLIN